MRDHRLVVAGAADAPRCYVSDMGWDSCWPWAHLAWAFDDEARARAARPGTWRAASPPLLPGGTVDAPAWAAAAAALPAGPDGSPPDIVLASVGGGFPAAEPGSPPGAAWPGLPPDLAARVDRLAEVCSLLMCPDYCLVQNTRCDWRAAACVPEPL